MNRNINLHSVLCSKYYPGIGATISSNLIENFGPEGLIDQLNLGGLDELAIVKGVSYAKASTLVVGFSIVPGLIKLARYLDDIGLMKPYALKFYAVWGEDSLKVISANPYVLLATMKWSDVDPLGLAQGNPYHPCRIIGAIEWCLYREFEEEKNTASDCKSLCGAVCKLVSCDTITFQRGMKLALQTNAVKRHVGMYQVPAVYHYERLVEKEFLNNKRTGLSESDVNRWLDNSKYKDLTAEQRQAVENAMLYRFSTYYGRGGRGKTWTLKAVVSGVQQKLNKKRVVLAAIAAKAVRRMQVETQHPTVDCKTIAALLYVEYSDSLRESLIVIDEASMLSLVDMYQLFRKIPSTANLVLLGDHNQIPSIHAGRFFYDLIKSNVVPNVELTISHRHDTKTDQQLNAILNGKLPVFSEFTGDSVSGIYRCSIDDLVTSCSGMGNIEDAAIALYLEFWRRKETVQIISPLRDIRYVGSSDSINRKAHLMIFKEKSRQRFCAGTPVVWSKNMTVDEGVVLSNGSVGYVSEIFPQSAKYCMSVCFEHEGVVFLKWYEVKEYLEYSYCLSVHRAQGSEWDNVIVVMPESGRLVDRNMVYTALSRCRKRSIIIYSDHNYLAQKVAAPPAHVRRRSVFMKGILA